MEIDSVNEQRISRSRRDTTILRRSAPKFWSRRDVLAGAAGAAALSFVSVGHAKQVETNPDYDMFAALEARVGGRLGVCVLNTRNEQLVGNRLDERFGMCSTFKALLAAMILREIEREALNAEQVVPYTEKDMVFYAPVTSENLAAGGMTVEALAHATQTTSDNVAANLLLGLIGGPEGFTQRLREADDHVTRLDRYEPEMNLVPMGEVRDTSTPRAMAFSLRHFLLGDGLSGASQERLIRWMRETRTGRRRIRAGLPLEWAAGDKTGSGIAPTMVNKYNDVAIAWPPDRAPVIIACYYDAPAAYDSIRKEDEAVLAEVGRLAAEWIEA
jgi:beta-lactamase class A